MFRAPFCIAIFLVLIAAAACTAISTQPDSNQNAGYDYRANALRGDLSGVADPLIRELGRVYQAYWRAALLNPDRRESVENEHGIEVLRAIALHAPAHKDISQDKIFNRIAEVIAERGYQAIGGRTSPLLELIVWRENRHETVLVELTDGEFEIPITYQQDFVIRGWAHFATFGEASAGGWATRDGLFCVTEAYDTGSENFLVSFLKHEGRHYVDYEKYPSLPGADLEYRAKLTELAFANDTLFSLLRKFEVHARPSKDAPHSQANWQVTRVLTRKLQLQEPAEIQRKNISAGDIRKAASELLRESDRRLASRVN